MNQNNKQFIYYLFLSKQIHVFTYDHNYISILNAFLPIVITVYDNGKHGWNMLKSILVITFKFVLKKYEACRLMNVYPVY